MPPASAADLARLPWDSVLAHAKGQTVVWRMWRGDPSINAFIDDWVAPRVREQFGVTLQAVNGQGNELVDQLSVERQANATTGAASLLWINGETFGALHARKLISGPWSQVLPSAALVDSASPIISRDFEQDPAGYESPWGTVQLAMIYDSTRTPQPPRTLAELAAWIRTHPGRFTYDQSFAGITFLKGALYALNGGSATYAGGFDSTKYVAGRARLFAWLDSLKPFLWRNGTQYPPDVAALHRLFANGEIEFSLSNNQNEAVTKALQGVLPKSSHALVLRDGTHCQRTLSRHSVQRAKCRRCDGRCQLPAVAGSTAAEATTDGLGRWNGTEPVAAANGMACAIRFGGERRASRAGGFVAPLCATGSIATLSRAVAGRLAADRQVIRRSVPLVLAALLLGVPVVAGIGYLVVGALGAEQVGDAGAFARVVRDPAVLRSAALSLWIATAGTVLALIVALVITLLLDGDSRIERITRRIAVLPLPVPTVAATVAALLLLSQSGWLSRAALQLHLVATPAEFPALVYDPLAIGVILAVVWKEMPFLLLVALSLQSLRGRLLADTARTHGASPRQVVRHVTLPLLLRGMAPSVVAVFVFVLGSLELPVVLGPSSPLALPQLIQERRQALDAALHGDAYAIGLLATALAAIAALLYEWLRGDAA